MARQQLFDRTLSETELRGHVHEALAKVRALDLHELEREAKANGGDLKIDSKEAEVVLSMLEERRLLKENSVKVEDLEQDQLSTVSTLVRLIFTALAA